MDEQTIRDVVARADVDLGKARKVRDRIVAFVNAHPNWALAAFVAWSALWMWL